MNIKQVVCNKLLLYDTTANNWTSNLIKHICRRGYNGYTDELCDYAVFNKAVETLAGQEKLVGSGLTMATNLFYYAAAAATTILIAGIYCT
jgi:hypothetical protein